MLEDHIIGMRRYKVGDDRRAIIKLREGTNINWYAVRGDIDKHKIIALFPEEFYLSNNADIQEWKMDSRTTETPDVPLFFHGNEMHLSRFYRKLMGATNYIELIGCGAWYEIWKPGEFDDWRKNCGITLDDVFDYLAGKENEQRKEEKLANKDKLTNNNYNLAA
ncbi:TPA: hypothetical protein HA246_05765 [Candidatus Woesearchaeota archaeon]|nr:hypothetical protein [Candidatus Woesearchaeota archaeon]